MNCFDFGKLLQENNWQVSHSQSPFPFPQHYLTSFDSVLISLQTVGQAGVLDVKQPVLALLWSRREVAGDVGVGGQQEESQQEKEQEKQPVPVGADAGATARDGKTPFAQRLDGGRGKLNHLRQRDQNFNQLL